MFCCLHPVAHSMIRFSHTIINQQWQLFRNCEVLGVLLSSAQHNSLLGVVSLSNPPTIVIPLFLKYKICNLQHRTSREASLAQQHTLVERDTKIVLTKVCYTEGSI